MTNFFISINNNQQGPYTIEELKEMDIKEGTLAWKKGMDSWKKVEDIDELKDIVMELPPPLPKEEKTNSLKTETTKGNEKQLPLEAKAIAAKELKTNFNFILYAFIIGILAFPVFYFGVYNAPKYDNFDYSKVKRKITDGDIVIYGVPADVGKGELFQGLYLKNDVRNAIERRKEEMTQKSFSSSFITFLVAIGFLIISRYLLKGAKWVENTSKEGEKVNQNK